MMNDGRWPDPAHSRSALLRALTAYERGLAEAPLVRKWGTLAESAPPVGRSDAALPHPAASFVPRFKEADCGETLTFVASTDAVDRHGDTVAQEGWRLDAYRENPVLLWAHDYRRPAIGRAQSVWRDGGALLARLEFAPTEFAREVESLYRQGYQQGVSVGFRPLRFQERRNPHTGAFLGIRFLEQELLEISAVPVPANQEALAAGRNGTVDAVVALLREMRA